MDVITDNKSRLQYKDMFYVEIQLARKSSTIQELKFPLVKINSIVWSFLSS